ncbi:hypothetical protein HDR58_02015 [bacterium]|nr:hypothetical protein [bacterium]
MNRTIYHHSFTPLKRSDRGGIIQLSQHDELGPMFDGQVLARDMARTMQADVEHRVYNNELHKWDYLGTFHPDGTATDSFGQTRRFIEDPARPWAEIEKGGES